MVGLNIDDKDFWNHLVSLSPPTVAVTNGRNGAFVFAEGKHYFSPIINVKPIDETGAGDAFGSTFVSALIYKHTPQKALFWAIKNSASVVSAIGTKTTLLTLKQIKE